MMGNFHFIRPEWLLLIVPLIVVLIMNWREAKSRIRG